MAKSRKELSFHEKDLANHITDGSDEHAGNKDQGGTTDQPQEPQRESVKVPHMKNGKEQRDSQLDRALDLLKGVDRFGPTP
jgi:hypothetical protein